ncbi:type I methionyl aminopeptidase [Marinimicrococcus flavescens]|uniref:Methionine aminopeptidase n=1 Tax=Marinimicrococcus flavescens TaxID=3031815 RepID=A0AAP3XPS5_9PROT|nr:type I methionyl aminopeptidase [Marinimicrococcus flavescens]
MRGRAKSRPQVPLLGRDGLAAMRRAGRLAAATLDMIGAEVATGVATDRLDTLCHDFIRDHGARPAPLGYQGYPRATCISVGEVVCHGIPGPRRLAEGDIVNIDVTVVLDGWYGDTSRMYWVGAASEAARRLCQVTFEALWRGIRAVRPGATLGDLGHAVQVHAEAHGCSVVRDYCGHGIGRRFHQPPTVLHHGKPGRGMSLEPGMSFTIEPMLNLGGHEVDVLEDGWTVVTKDASLSAQFEHTVVVTETGVEVMTLSPEGQHHPPW